MTQARYAPWHDMFICKECSRLQMQQQQTVKSPVAHRIQVCSADHFRATWRSAAPQPIVSWVCSFLCPKPPPRSCWCPFGCSWGNHLCPEIYLQIRPWQGWWLLLFPATSLHKWLSPFTQKKKIETSDTLWLCAKLLFAIDQWPSRRQPLTPFTLKKPHY